MTKPDPLLADIAHLLETGQPIRKDFGRGERLHIDRPMPFLCVHLGKAHELAARDLVTSNSAYLVVASLKRAKAIIALVADAMRERFGGFVLFDMGEFAHDKMASDTAYLPPFEVSLSAGADEASQSAAAAFAAATQKVKVRFRTPQLTQLPQAQDPAARLARQLPAIPTLTLRLAPIYRTPDGTATYPQLHEQMVANLVDASLQALAAFAEASTSLAVSTHRALGRKAFIDAVSRADRAMDEVAQSFDFLLSVTPINSGAAWEEFSASSFERAPTLLYRPLTISQDRQKRQLFSIALDHLEDPVLTTLYREKQQELDLQLSLLAARETPRFVEISRALYGPVEPSLLRAAQDVLDAMPGKKRGTRNAGQSADSAFVEREARAMIKHYAGQSADFSATIELREDLPSGLMVSGGKLLIARSTTMPRTRVEALLSHEVGVHLLTYFNGSAQGLRLFRSGLAGYEGVQEGLAVLSEYLVGGMTPDRLRLIAARVIGCHAMLDGASFVECFRLVRDLGLAPASAFNLTLRVYRGGGLAKDAVYLRGLLEVLAHLRSGGALEPFWMGKIAATHFRIMQELNTRGLLRAPQLHPAFLSHPDAGRRLKAASAGLTPIDLLAS
ncbi:conserved hypothetical protein [Devosia crocina]|uniref:Flavohemoglobin expression-modulating QEGLA motif protein n=1 Tax=Devosia crocina TaxID=429728 RepID=A0A1I7N044_9HYPH|nr:flavohemoglobin expression-modulating QEGLA motif protein [Devosia crocina]SFV28047.1 conserved hypothetical protein [Devosia crocina]